MTEQPKRDGVREVIAFAAATPEFAELLFRDRAAALSSMDLDPAEEAILLSAPEEQLRKMIAESRKRPWIHRKASRAGCLVAGAALAAAIIYPMTLTAGIRLEENRCFLASHCLQQLSEAERIYHNECGSYATLETLLRRYGMNDEYAEWIRRTRYTYSIELRDDGSFIARARDARDEYASWVIGPDGIVREEKE